MVGGVEAAPEETAGEGMKERDPEDAVATRPSVTLSGTDLLYAALFSENFTSPLIGTGCGGRILPYKPLTCSDLTTLTHE